MAKTIKSSSTLPEIETDFPQLRLLLTDDVQERYEVARPLLLQQPVTAAQRSRETGAHPRTIRRYVRRFEREGMRGLFDERALLVRGHSVPEVVRFEVIRLKTLYPPLHLREITNIIFARLGCRIDHKTTRGILQQYGVLDQQRLPFAATRFHDHSDPKTARLEVIKLYYQGWNIKSIAGFLGLSRQHIYNLLERFEQEQLAAAMPRSRAPHHPHRKLYLPVLKRIAELQCEYPYIGRFRLWSLLKREGIADLGESTVGAAMALNRLAYSELSAQAKPPRVHPFTSRTWHQFWFIDHRYLTKIDGVQYYSLCILEGFSRAFLAGVVLATQARGPVLKLLYETVAQWGAPLALVSDSGGAFISHDYARVCERLGIVVRHIDAQQSWQNMIETHFNIQRKMTDFQFARCGSEGELQQEHAHFIEVYNTSEHLAHQKRKTGHRTPQTVLSWVRGQPVASGAMTRAFRELRWQRVADRAGYVLVQNYYLYAERAASRQRVCLWLCDDRLQIDYRDEVLASYPCAFNEDAGQIEKVGEPILYGNSLARQQPRLLEIGPDQWQRLRRLERGRRQRRSRTSRSQLLLLDVKAAERQWAAEA